jgi:hypothetical protein
LNVSGEKIKRNVKDVPVAVSTRRTTGDELSGTKVTEESNNYEESADKPHEIHAKGIACG